MGGVKAKYLLGIVDFLYFGEAGILQENLDNFLALAEEMQLKGLTKEYQDKTEPEPIAEHIFKKSEPNITKKKSTENQRIKIKKKCWTVYRIREKSYFN